MHQCTKIHYIFYLKNKKFPKILGKIVNFKLVKLCSCINLEKKFLRQIQTSPYLLLLSMYRPYRIYTYLPDISDTHLFRAIFFYSVNNPSILMIRIRIFLCALIKIKLCFKKKSNLNNRLTHYQLILWLTYCLAFGLIIHKSKSYELSYF